MSNDLNERQEEATCASLLAAWDEALAGGSLPPLFREAEVSSELRQRLERNFACLQLLEQVWPRGQEPGTTGQGLGSQADESSPTPVRELGRFQIVRELGRSGYGVVYLAYDPLLCREVALKLPRAEMTLTPEHRLRFRQEALAAARLDHPNVVPVYEAGEIGPVSYIASAYCPGVSLAGWLQQRSAPVPCHEAAALVAALADGVQHAHSRGVLHRDLKPANVLVSGEWSETRSPTHHSPLTTHQFKITDFGLAKLAEEDAPTPSLHTDTGTILGTASYMAPEQAEGKSKEIGTAADVYALGAILYELLTGRPVFQADSVLATLEQVRSQEPVPPRRLQAKLPRDLETISLKCLQKQPDQRYASAHALGEDLRRFLAGEPIQARPVGGLERLGRWCRRNPALAAASGLAVLALLAVVILSIGYGIERSHTAERLREALDDAESQRGLADQAAADARRKQAQTQAALNESRRQAAMVAFERALSLCEHVDCSRGLLWLTRSLALAPDDATDLQRVIRLNLGGWQRELRVPHLCLEHGDCVTAVAFSPDGRMLLTAGFDGVVRRWDAQTGLPVGAPLRHSNRHLDAMAVSPDGKLLVTGSRDRTAQLWDLATGEPSGPPWPHPNTVRSVAFGPDGRLVVTGCEDGSARLWELPAGRCVRQFAPHPGPVWAVAFSRDGKRIVTGSGHAALGAGHAQLWAVGSGEAIGPPMPHDLGVLAVALSPDGHTLVTAGPDKTQLWEAATGTPLGLPLLPQAGPVVSIAFSPDGGAFVTASWDRTVRLWETATRRPLGAPAWHRDQVRAVALSPDGRTMLTGCQDGTAWLWKVVSPQATPMLTLEGGGVPQAAGPGGKTLLTGGFGESARLWDTTTGKPLGPPVSYAGEIESAAVSPDQQTFLIGSSDETAQLFQAATGKLLVPPLKNRAAVRSVAFSPDGKMIVTGTWRIASAWETATGKRLPQLFGHPDGSILALAFSLDGRLLATGGSDNTARLWNAATGEPLGLPLRHQGSVFAVAFSPDSKFVLTGTINGWAHLWDVATGKQLGPPINHSWQIFRVAFSPDGKLLVTAGSDGTLRLWDRATCKPASPLLVHSSGPTMAIMAVAFDPDGRSFWTASWDKTLHRWEVPVAAQGDLERLILETEVLSRMELDPAGQIQVLDGKTWQERRQRLANLNSRE